MQACPRSPGEALRRVLGRREGGAGFTSARGVGRADVWRRIGERPGRLPGGVRRLDASGARSYGASTHQGRCRMTVSIGEGDSSMTKGGPVTREGKEVVKWNATQHGTRSPAAVVPGVEKREDWEVHRDGMMDSLQPEGHLELVLAERVALLSWRLHRVTRYETESIALYQERAEEDLAKERRFGSGPDRPEAVRGNAKSDRDDHRLFKRFAKMEDDKPLSALDADRIIWDAMECADKVAEGEVDPEELLESVSVSGLPDSDSWEGYEGWTAGLVRAVIEAVAPGPHGKP